MRGVVRGEVRSRGRGRRFVRGRGGSGVGPVRPVQERRGRQERGAGQAVHGRREQVGGQRVRGLQRGERSLLVAEGLSRAGLFLSEVSFSLSLFLFALLALSLSFPGTEHTLFTEKYKKVCKTCDS